MRKLGEGEREGKITPEKSGGDHLYVQKDEFSPYHGM